MMEYKGTKITMFEGTEYNKDGLEVNGQGKLFYVAEHKYGKSFANQAQDALEGAKTQIDKATK